MTTPRGSASQKGATMKIAENTSHWQSCDVRALFYECAKRRGATLPRVKVTVNTWRGQGAAAHATTKVGNRYEVELSIARPQRFNPCVVDALSVADGEAPFGTLRGADLTGVLEIIDAAVRQIRVGCARSYRASDLPWLPSSEMVLRPKIPRRKERLTGSAYHTSKKQNAERLLVEWERKLALAETKVKKYQREIAKRKRLIRVTKEQEKAAAKAAKAKKGAQNG